MAQYIFALTRSPADSSRLRQRMQVICAELTPDLIRDQCKTVVADWPGVPAACYAIQNSDGVAIPDAGQMVIGWVVDVPEAATSHVGVESDGSYAVVKAAQDVVSFFTDQFGSRSLWYYADERLLVVSTSQRAVVGLKGRYCCNDEALAWFLSSGSQGPFISWDREVHQVRPGQEYVFDVASWKLARRAKPGMELPESGTMRMGDYLQAFERQVSGTLSSMVSKSGPGGTLLPLSGGLDSRLLLGLCRNVGIEDKVTLVNWGVPAGEGVFDDKAAARRVARAYGKPLMDMALPAKPESHEEVLERFARESEGRIDHFNAFTDGFVMWAGFFHGGFWNVVRGDLPYTEGLDLDEAQSRAHIGVEPFTDYVNQDGFPLEAYVRLQQPYDVSRQQGESYLRWRDRLYVEWRMPLVISAFSDLMSGYAESRTPMVNWSLFRQYMALPDSAKGSKTHIKALWKRHDGTGVPSHATGSLRSLSDFFKGEAGTRYLDDGLDRCRETGRFSSELVSAVKQGLGQEAAATGGPAASGLLSQARSWVADHLPDKVKAHLKARRVKRLSATTLAYRMVLADKVIGTYEAAANVGAEAGR